MESKLEESYFDIESAINEMARCFSKHCKDRTTLDEIIKIASDDQSFTNARALVLLSAIAHKKSSAKRNVDNVLQYQYAFEEACVKSLYNLSGYPVPFEEEYTFWIIPRAVQLANALGIKDFADISTVFKFNANEPPKGDHLG